MGDASRSPTVLWSILICTMPERKELFDSLYTFLQKQIAELKEEEKQCVEILFLNDDEKDILEKKRKSVGAKRQLLLQSANGKYISYIDDDDWVADDYVSRILDALQKSSDVDCCDFCADIIKRPDSGLSENKMINSIRFWEWCTWPGVYVKCPTHFNVIKKSLAIDAGGFKDYTWAEDYDFSIRLRWFLKTEVSVGTETALYYYRTRE